MTAAPNFYAKARRETAELLGYDLERLTAEQALRLDTAAALRLALDHLQGAVVRGESIDITKMLTASEALARLLPPTVLATPPSEQREDPRVVLWNIIKEGRDRAALGFEGYDGKCRQIEALQGEVAALKAQLVGAGLAPALPVVPNSTAITPSEADITPPGELGSDCYVGMRPGPDDRPRRPPQVIEGKAVPKSPAASAARPSRPPDWDDTPSGKAWSEWRDAGGYGGPGFDRWSNRNIP
jgi:hypothetical protein